VEKVHLLCEVRSEHREGMAHWMRCREPEIGTDEERRAISLDGLRNASGHFESSSSARRAWSAPARAPLARFALRAPFVRMIVGQWLQPDWLAWVLAPILAFELVRSARVQVRLARRPARRAYLVSGVEALLAFACLSARTPLVLAITCAAHFVMMAVRERGVWRRGAVAIVGICAALILLAVAGGGASSFGSPELARVDPDLRSVVLVLVVASCVLSLLPVKVQDETKGAHVVPTSLVAFARVAVPLTLAEPRLTQLVPFVAAGLSLVSAFWLLTAGMQATHFEREALVSELLVCERGVLFSFVWLGLAAGNTLARVGAVLEWCAAALALVTLESVLRAKALSKPKAFFAVAMAVGLPGTIGFVAEDLLAHGLIELRPLVAMGFVGIGALNAAALFLAIVNVVVEGGYDPTVAPRPTMRTIVPAAVALITGLFPRPFVSAATLAQDALAPPVAQARAWSEAFDVPPP